MSPHENINEQRYIPQCHTYIERLAILNHRKTVEAYRQGSIKMTDKVKAFLSHSSKDKGLVSKIFKKLGAANAHYDEKTFEHGETSANEIFEAIRHTSVFVLFLSNNSIDSPWVQTEIRLAQQKLSSLGIKKILVFLLDEVATNKIPEWLLDYVYRKHQSVGVITTSIRSALLETVISKSSAIKIFMGRENEVRKLKEELSNPIRNAPHTIFLSGNEGIGRRTIAKKSLHDIHPQLIALPIEITLGTPEGEIEFYRHLLNESEEPTLLKMIDKLENFEKKSPSEKTEEILILINKITDQNQIIFLRGSDSIVKDDGYIQDWIASLINKMQPSAWPKLVIIARRMISSSKRSIYSNTSFHAINSLDNESSKKLLNIWIKHYREEIDPLLQDEIIEYVTGHPKNIQLAATLASEFGTAGLKSRRSEFLETVRQQSRSMLDDLSLKEPGCEKLLAIFREYEYLAYEDLLEMQDIPDDEMQKTMSYLLDHGIIENDSSYLRLAPYLIDVLSRHDWSEETKEFTVKCRKKILGKVEHITSDDLVKISTIDATILSALRQSNESNISILSRCLLPSHLLKVAKEFYDKKSFSKAIDLAQKAYSGKNKLSVEAQTETLRLICLAGIRLGLDEPFDTAQDNLNEIKTRQSSRVAAFTKGFKARYTGKIDAAERHFRDALNLGGERNFHILRELAQILKMKEEYIEAEKFARSAISIVDNNPFIIDILLEIIIEQNKDHTDYLQQCKEIEELFENLYHAAKKEKRSFYESRQAHYYSCLNQPDEAEKWAKKAVEATPSHIPVLIILARIQIDHGKIEDAKTTIDKIKKQIYGAGINADKRNTMELDKIYVLLAIEEGRFNDARQKLRSAYSLPEKIRESLKQKVDIAEAYSQ